MKHHIGDTNKMSDTPRTDARRGFHDLDTAVDAEFSEKLERELNAANDRIKRLKAVVNDPHALWTNWLRGDVELPVGIGDVREYQDHIHRLGQAGDEIEMILLGYASRVELPKTMAIEQSDLAKRLCVNWRKAKEDKQ